MKPDSYSPRCTSARIEGQLVAANTEVFKATGTLCRGLPSDSVMTGITARLGPGARRAVRRAAAHRLVVWHAFGFHAAKRRVEAWL